MLHIHIAALEPDAEFAKKIGKKGSESDFTIYNCKESERIMCLYHPNKHPDKNQPLLYSLALADAAYLRPQTIDKYTGEMIVTAAIFGKPVLVATDRVSQEEIEPLLKAAGLKQYEFFDGDEKTETSFATAELPYSSSSPYIFSLRNSSATCFGSNKLVAFSISSFIHSFSDGKIC